jgi:hypothetical protein
MYNDYLRRKLKFGLVNRYKLGNTCIHKHDDRPNTEKEDDDDDKDFGCCPSS